MAGARRAIRASAELGVDAANRLDRAEAVFTYRRRLNSKVKVSVAFGLTG